MNCQNQSYSQKLEITNLHNIDPQIATEITNVLIDQYPFYQLTRTSSKKLEKGQLSTSKLRKKYIKNNLPYVEPCEYTLGYRDGKARTFAYTPILSVLRQLLRKVDVLNLILSVDGKENQAEFSSYLDGSFFRENVFLQENNVSLLIGLYQDDFELSNPLGTSKKIHKISAFYWTLINLPHRFRSVLHSIQTCILCKSIDFKFFGIDSIINPLLRDLSTLETHGVYVDLLGEHILGTLVYISCDNLGAHTIGGFHENFSTVKYFCRFCSITLDEFQNAGDTSISIKPLLDKELYDEEIRKLGENSNGHNTTRLSGIKRECSFHKQLKHFHITRGLPPDICHDLLEGIVPYELALAINSFIRNGYFSLQCINERISKFPYKDKDITNKPHALNLSFSTSLTVGGNATENRCLLKLLFLLVGAEVPEDNKIWQLLLELKDIVNLCHASSLTETDICFLETKIISHHSLFKECFPSNKLKPKHHFLQHYPFFMRRFGPLVQCSTIRYEAKHSEFKNVVRSKKNYKNICKMLSENHQLTQALHLSGPHFFVPNVFAHQINCIDFKLYSESEINCIKSYPTELLYTLPKVDINGIVFKPGHLIVYCVDLLPQFGKIKGVFVEGNKIFFLVHILITGFIEHIRMYCVSPSDDFKIINSEDCKDFYPLVDYVYKGETVVPLKHWISLD